MLKILRLIPLLLLLTDCLTLCEEPDSIKSKAVINGVNNIHYTPDDDLSMIFKYDDDENFFYRIVPGENIFDKKKITFPGDYVYNHHYNKTVYYPENSKEKYFIEDILSSKSGWRYPDVPLLAEPPYLFYTWQLLKNREGSYYCRMAAIDEEIRPGVWYGQNLFCVWNSYFELITKKEVRGDFYYSFLEEDIILLSYLYPSETGQTTNTIIDLNTNTENNYYLDNIAIIALFDQGEKGIIEYDSEYHYVSFRNNGCLELLKGKDWDYCIENDIVLGSSANKYFRYWYKTGNYLIAQQIDDPSIFSRQSHHTVVYTVNGETVFSLEEKNRVLEFIGISKNEESGSGEPK